MTKAQRSHFFGRLWPAACQAQGWDVKDEDTRRAVCERVTGARSTSGLTERQITLLFAEVKHLAAPLDFDAALAASNPDAAEEASQVRRHLFAIDKLGLPDSFITGLARNIVAARRAKSWRGLSSTDLHWLVRTLSNRARASNKAPVVSPSDCPF